ncbi:MAG: hypothetical protein LKI80_06125 [Sporolactobacillus sp.]|jgi:hypothetical protein|nr:hypothetical protein [Sporolactobacillus sp.]
MKNGVPTITARRDFCASEGAWIAISVQTVFNAFRAGSGTCPGPKANCNAARARISSFRAGSGIFAQSRKVWMRRLSYRQHIEFVDANGKPAADLAAAVRAKALEKGLILLGTALITM